MIATFTWAITIISLTGTILNVKKNALCFWLWAFGNTAWLSYDLWLGLYSRAALDVVQPCGITECPKPKAEGIGTQGS